MRLLLTCDFGPAEKLQRVLVQVEGSNTVQELAQALNLSPDIDLFVGPQPLNRSMPIGESLLVNGGTLTTIPRESQLVNLADPRPVEIQVTANSTAYSIPLSLGSHTIGRLDVNDIVIADPAVSGQHAVIDVGLDRVSVTDLHSSNGTWVNEVRIPEVEPTTVEFNQFIEIGDTKITLTRRDSMAIHLSLDGDGGLTFNRPSRIREPEDTFVISFPDDFDEREAGFDLLGTALPGATGLAYGSAIPLVGTGINVALQKRKQRSAKKELAKRRADYEDEMATVETILDEEIDRQRTQKLEQYPSPDMLLTLAHAPSPRLWERRAGDPDDADVRVGLGIRRANIAFESHGQQVPASEMTIESAPIVLNLNKIRVLGIAGNLSKVRSTARWIIGQQGYFRPPRDFSLVILTDRSTSAEWDWFPFLPHSSPDPNVLPWLIGNDDPSRDARIKELTALMDERRGIEEESRGVVFSPDVLVVLDGARELRSTPGVVKLLQEGPKYGIGFLALDDDPARLPEECGGVLHLFESGGGSLRVDGQKVIDDIEIDGVSSEWSLDLAKLLSPIRLFLSGHDGAIPRSIRFTEMIDLDLEDPQNLVNEWRSNGRSTIATVGQGASGILNLDLEKDGPHALVAGTTGAGKSEFLQTFVASLALANRPEALNFVLVDYKGASAFAECAALPHTVGMVTNLDGHLTERALRSLEAELKRREIELKALGAKDLNDAWRFHPDEAPKRGLSRLVLMIDEFAELVQELPDFVSGLIRIARVGRSLGVHLVLATQRPAGVVTPEMRANTGLRVALRMEDKADSSEVIDAPNAASVSRLTPGRGFVRAGGMPQLHEFQTARVGGGRTEQQIQAEPPSVMEVGWASLGLGPRFPKKEAVVQRETDLSAICALMIEAANLGGFDVPRRPWLDPLPLKVHIEEVQLAQSANRSASLDQASEATSAVAIGLIDLPDFQRQDHFLFDLSKPASWGIAGSSRSGRTSTLITLAVALMQALPPTDLSVFGLDFGGGGLLGLAEFAHCGGIIRPTESERMEQFIAKLSEEHRRRQSLLSTVGASNISEYRSRASTGEQLGYILVLIDRWELVVQEFPLESGSNVHSDLSRLIRESSTTGLRFVLTGDRGLLSDRISSHLTDRFALALNDLNDYRMLDLQPKNVPSTMGPGRAVRAGDGAEIQFALFDANTDRSPREVLAELAGQLTGPRPLNQLRVDPLPERITVDAARKLPPHPSSELGAIFAVGGDSLSAIAVNLSGLDSGFLISGPRRSGRTTALLRLTREAIEEGLPVVVWAQMSAPVFAGIDSELITILPPESSEHEFPTDRIDSGSSILFIVDDAEGFLRTPLDGSVVELLRGHAPLKVVMAGQPEDLANDLRGTASVIKRSQCGMILRPQSPMDGQVFGHRLERSLLGGPPGRGQFFMKGQQLRVQVVTD